MFRDDGLPTGAAGQGEGLGRGCPIRHPRSWAQLQREPRTNPGDQFQADAFDAAKVLQRGKRPLFHDSTGQLRREPVRRGEFPFGRGVHRDEPRRLFLFRNLPGGPRHLRRQQG